MDSNQGRTSKTSSSWLRVLTISLLAVVTICLGFGRAKAQADHETLVREFVAAFNARNIEAMRAAVDEKIQWLSVHDGKITIETEGQNALGDSMARYFRSCPTCKSTLEWVKKSGSRIMAMERATWTGKSGPKSQAGLSVYEFRNGKILRVYYFPADADETPTAANK